MPILPGRNVCFTVGRNRVALQAEAGHSALIRKRGTAMVASGPAPSTWKTTPQTTKNHRPRGNGRVALRGHMTADHHRRKLRPCRQRPAQRHDQVVKTIVEIRAVEQQEVPEQFLLDTSIHAPV